MHPTIEFEVAKARVADMQHQAERDTVVRTARAARRAGASRGTRGGRRLSAPGALAQRLLRLS
jgi:DNA invertase Pin-like site-specific DNA recombinase